MSQSVSIDQRTASPDRLESIDQFRGLAIFLMALADYLNNVEITPAWLKHAPDVGYTVIDLIVVDDRDRQPIGRPYLTLAIDVFTRCVPSIQT